MAKEFHKGETLLPGNVLAESAGTGSPKLSVSNASGSIYTIEISSCHTSGLFYSSTPPLPGEKSKRKATEQELHDLNFKARLRLFLVHTGQGHLSGSTKGRGLGEGKNPIGYSKGLWLEEHRIRREGINNVGKEKF